VQIAGGDEREEITQRPVGIRPERVELIESGRRRRVGAKEGGDFLGARFVDAQIGGVQGRVVGLKLRANLLPGERLSTSDLGAKGCENDSEVK